MRSTTVSSSGRQIDCGRADVTHPFFQPMFEMQPADDPTGDDGDAKPEAEISERHLPADQPEQKSERHLVDHRRGNQKRKRHAERHARADEADEQRHCGTGTERRHDAERRRQYVADTFMFSGKECSGFLRRKVAAHDAHGEYHQREQHQHLGRIVGEEADRLAEMTIGIDVRRCQHPVREWHELAVDGAPSQEGDDRPADPFCGRRAGARRTVSDCVEAHAACLS